MVGAATFHTVATELVMGMFSLAAICITFRLFSSLAPEELWAELRKKLDSITDMTALVAASVGIVFVPMAIFTGTQAAPSDLGNPYLFNKFLLSGLAMGLWIGYIHGRIQIGAQMWNRRSIAILQGGLGLTAFGVTTLIATMGGKVARGESLMDLMPFGLPLDSSIVLQTGPAAFLFLLSLIALIVVIYVQPKQSSEHLK